MRPNHSIPGVDAELIEADQIMETTAGTLVLHNSPAGHTPIVMPAGERIVAIIPRGEWITCYRDSEGVGPRQPCPRCGSAEVSRS